MLNLNIYQTMPRSHIHGMDAGISHGYNPASFVAIRFGPQLSVLHPLSYVVVLSHTYIVQPYHTTEISISAVIREILSVVEPAR